MHGTSYLQLIGPMKMPSFGLSHMTYLVIPHAAKKKKKKKTVKIILLSSFNMVKIYGNSYLMIYVRVPYENGW